MHIELDIDMPDQPDDSSCGPTSLYSVYKFFGLDVTLETVIKELDGYDPAIGSYDAILGIDALKRGFDAIITPFNLNVFDWSWFGLNMDALRIKLDRLASVGLSETVRKLASLYVEFIDRGGRIVFQYNPEQAFFTANYYTGVVPLICGLSSTWIHQSKRENPDTGEYDEYGRMMGHYVVLGGWEWGLNPVRTTVYDPYGSRTLFRSNKYILEYDQLLTAMMLGTNTHEGNLLRISKRA